MGRFSYEEADHYGSNGGGSYFKLSNDGDVARVRLLGYTMDDFPGYACHEVMIGDSRRVVNCLREYKDPVDKCPFCAAKKKVVAKLYIPLFNIDANEVQVWERGKSFFKILSGYITRHKNVVRFVTEIERSGKAGSTSTTYQLYEAVDDEPDDSISLEDFEIPDILGRYILDKTAEDMEYFLDNGKFPDEVDLPFEDDEPRARRGSRSGGRRTSDKGGF